MIMPVRGIVVISLVVLAVLACGVVVTLAASGGGSARITKAQAIAFARTVNLQASDVPRGKVLAIHSFAPQEMLRCGDSGRLRHPVGGETSSLLDPHEALVSAVQVMPNEALAKADLAAITSQRGRICIAHTLGELETIEGEKKVSSFAVKVAIVPVVKLLGPEAIVLHVLAELPSLETPPVTFTRPAKKRVPRLKLPGFIHVDVALFRVGPAEILFFTFGTQRQFPATTEGRLLALLHSRAEAHKL